MNLGSGIGVVFMVLIFVRYWPKVTTDLAFPVSIGLFGLLVAATASGGIFEARRDRTGGVMSSLALHATRIIAIGVVLAAVWAIVRAMALPST